KPPKLGLSSNADLTLIIILDCNCSKYQQATASIQRRYTWCGLSLSKQPRAANSKMTSFTGVFLLVFSVLVVDLNTANFFAFDISFFISLLGGTLGMVGNS